MKESANEVLQLLPINIVNSKNFTPKNKYLLATLIFLNGLDKVKSDGYFFRTNLMLAKEANIAEKNLLINLRKLEQINFINRKAGKRGEASEYIINENIIFSYIDKLDSKVSNDSSKVSDKLDSKVSDKSNKVSDKSNKVSDKMSDKVSNNKVSNDSDKVSNKLDNIILKMSVLEELLQQFISTYNSDKVSNEINTKVSTDTDIDSESDSDIEKEYILNNINKKDNISNNILEKNLLEKLAERMKDKNSDKECSVDTPHSNVGNVIECTPSKSFLFSLIGEEDKTSDTVESNSMKEEISNFECSSKEEHSNEEPKLFSFSSLEDKTNSIDTNNNNTSTETPLSSSGLIDKTKDEQPINLDEKVLENALKQEVLSTKEKEDKTIKKCSSTEHSNGDKFYNDFAFFVEELNKEEEINGIDTNNNTPTEMSLSSAVTEDNSSSEEDVAEGAKVQQSEAKERIVKSAEVLIEKLTKILSREELISKATLYVEWLERQKDTINCEELFQSLMDKGSEVFATTYDRVDGEESKKNVVVDIAIESFEEEKIDEVVSDFFGSSPVEQPHVETEEAIIRVLSTGELITVEEAKKRGGTLGAIEDISASRCDTRRRKTDYSYHFQW